MRKYTLLLIGSLVAIVSMSLLANSINKKESERQAINKGREVLEPAKSSNWQKYYPRQYDSWKKTKNSIDLEDMLDKWPQLVIVWAGYPFSKDYNAPRGHYYAVQDNINSLRPASPKNATDGPLPSACWTCKSTDVVRIMEEQGDIEYYTGKWAKYGADMVNQIGCYDCHDPKTAQLHMKRDYVNKGLVAAGLPNFDTSTHQEKRNLVCAQCHSEYHFMATNYPDPAKPEANKTAMVVTLPWNYGLDEKGMEKYYNDPKIFAKPFADYTNSISKTPIVKAQHPDYELYKTGIHGKKGVSCADCHMPYTLEGATKFSDHQVGNPLDTMDRSCMTCHRESESKLKAIVKEKYDRKEVLFNTSVTNIAKAHLEAKKAWEVGASESEMAPVLADIRSAQWKWDYIVASHGGFFHAPEESLKVLADSNELAQSARLKLVSILAKHGVMNYEVPDFSTKEKAQKLVGLNMEAEVAAKQNFKDTMEVEWVKQAKEKGLFDDKTRDYADDRSSWFGTEKNKKHNH
ncbi:MAG: ammonia-forming cytochrome c nitrite reductase [Campylobacteraceae bacterium]|jgi:nitrite reductase (cytochrome c-552)|nr:ammonia-forming cytochrome c nitrite reductase [Campylobacteraceae bacterium]